MLFKGFDIPLQELSGEKFEQPILFGANNLSGIVQTNVAYAGGFFRPFLPCVDFTLRSIRIFLSLRLGDLEDCFVEQWRHVCTSSSQWSLFSFLNCMC